MTVRECYEKIGSDFDKVLGRLGSEALVKRFAVKFLEDKSFEELTESLKEKDGEDAFRAAHTLGYLRQSWAGQIIRNRLRADRKAARTSDRGQRGVISEGGRSVRSHSNRAKGAGKFLKIFTDSED